MCKFWGIIKYLSGLPGDEQLVPFVVVKPDCSSLRVHDSLEDSRTQVDADDKATFFQGNVDEIPILTWRAKK